MKHKYKGCMINSFWHSDKAIVHAWIAFLKDNFFFNRITWRFDMLTALSVKDYHIYIYHKYHFLKTSIWYYVHYFYAVKLILINFFLIYSPHLHVIISNTSYPLCIFDSNRDPKPFCGLNLMLIFLEQRLHLSKPIFKL